VPANYEALMSSSFKQVMEFPGFDRLAQIKAEYLAEQHARSNTRYGWVKA
jgi:hypothetical protein